MSGSSVDSPIAVCLAVEDALSEVVLRRMLLESSQDYVVGTVFSRGGFGYLKGLTPAFNRAASGMPYIVLTDLDARTCPLQLIADWLPQPKHPNLIFRIAVREVESWLLAHAEGFAKFLGVSEQIIPRDPETLIDPKQSVIAIARRSRNRVLREAIVPKDKSDARIGRDYNGQLAAFVNDHWSVSAALKRSQSLYRAMRALDTFVPLHR